MFGSARIAVASLWRTAIGRLPVVPAHATIDCAFRKSPTNEPAPSAVKSFSVSRAAKKRHVVPVDVRVAKVSPTATYNLTLAEHNAYYANGILVFNCGDALGLTFAAHVPPVAEQDQERDRFAGGPGSWMG